MAKRKRRTKAEMEAAKGEYKIYEPKEGDELDFSKVSRPPSKIIDICRRAYMYDKRITVEITEAEYEALSADMSIFSGKPRKSVEENAIIGVYIYTIPIRVIIADKDT